MTRWPVGLALALIAARPLAANAQRPAPDPPILYSEADARAAICYANSMPEIGAKLRGVPHPLVLLDGRRAQAVDSTLAHCERQAAQPKWVASVDYLADASIYGRRASAGAVRIKSAAYVLAMQRRDSMLAARRK
jgi:hypothetical protein